jgi:hypothetical protein
VQKIYNDLITEKFYGFYIESYYFTSIHCISLQLEICRSSHDDTHLNGGGH